MLTLRRVSSAFLTGALGVALGVRHAMEPDHLAAISTLASEEREVSAALRVGAWWGVGHCVSLCLVGGTLAALETQMPDRVGALLELLVSVMIVGLGVRAVYRSVVEGRSGRWAYHSHGTTAHAHAAPGDHVHLRRWTFATRPLVVGMMHGMAGSGAITALVVAELPSVGDRLSYIALFGIGSVVGMAMLTGLAGWPLKRLAQMPRMAALLLAFTGTLSVVIGVWWGAASLSRIGA